MFEHNYTLEIIFEITLQIVLKVFQTMIRTQSDFNEIVFDNVEMCLVKNRNLGSSRTNNRLFYEHDMQLVIMGSNPGCGI